MKPGQMHQLQSSSSATAHDLADVLLEPITIVEQHFPDPNVPPTLKAMVTLAQDYFWRSLVCVVPSVPMAVRLQLIALLLSTTRLAYSGAVNRTIDDEFGDSVTGDRPVYRPADQWHEHAQCPQCGVTMAADASKAFQQTWHDTSYEPNGLDPDGVSIEMSFTGTAIYIYSLVANAIPPTRTFMWLNFTIDGVQMSQSGFIHSPDPNGDKILYNQLVYSQTGLHNTLHTFSINATGLLESLVLFDYAIYTVEDSSVTDPPPPPISKSSSLTSASNPPPPLSQLLLHVSPSQSPNPLVPHLRPYPTESDQPLGGCSRGITAGSIIAVFVVSVILYCLYTRLRHRRARIVHLISVAGEQWGEHDFAIEDHDLFESEAAEHVRGQAIRFRPPRPLQDNEETARHYTSTRADVGSHDVPVRYAYYAGTPGPLVPRVKQDAKAPAPDEKKSAPSGKSKEQRRSRPPSSTKKEDHSQVATRDQLESRRPRPSLEKPESNISEQAPKATPQILDAEKNGNLEQE
ncbi:hypothetical protein C8Q74DRAFT_1441786 [Fomes fomentarius]|nr:hypothetical protein C8Q74DRAFT_1441786 [Fomes fomentarius]